MYPVTRKIFLTEIKLKTFESTLWTTKMQNVSTVIIPVLDRTMHNSVFVRSRLWVPECKKEFRCLFFGATKHPLPPPQVGHGLIISALWNLNLFSSYFA